MRLRLKTDNTKQTGVFVTTERLAETLQECVGDVGMSAAYALNEMEAKAKRNKQGTRELKALEDSVKRLTVFAMNAAEALDAVAKANNDNSVFAERWFDDEYGAIATHKYLGEMKIEEKAV